MIPTRAWFAAVALACIGLVGFALYQEVWAFLDPCPLCIFQRIAFIWMGLFAILAVVHGPGRTGYRVYAVLVALGAAVGAAIAGRHIWLQNLPADQVPECGPGLGYMLENFPLAEVLQTVFTGSGSCAEVSWTFLGLSMPWWTLIWYGVLGTLVLWAGFRRATP